MPQYSIKNAILCYYAIDIYRYSIHFHTSNSDMPFGQRRTFPPRHSALPKSFSIRLWPSLSGASVPLGVAGREWCIKNGNSWPHWKWLNGCSVQEFCGSTRIAFPKTALHHPTLSFRWFSSLSHSVRVVEVPVTSKVILSRTGPMDLGQIDKIR